MASVKVTDRIEASADQVWDLVRDFGGIQRFAPAIESVSVQGEGIGAVRTITLPGGVAAPGAPRGPRRSDRARSATRSSGATRCPSTSTSRRSACRRTEKAVRSSGAAASRRGAERRAQATGMVEGIYRSGIAGIKKALGG